MSLSNEKKKEMFWIMLLSRRLDERAWVLHRQGKIAFHISGIGQEAAQVGAVYAVEKGKDWLVPYYRDLSMMIAMGMSPAEFVMSLMGKAQEPTSGARQMPSHFSLRRANIVSHSAPVATQSPHASGIGLGIKMDGGDDPKATSRCQRRDRHQTNGLPELHFRSPDPGWRFSGYIPGACRGHP
ncbi:MAG: thiamine pyrophosphate-dependent enzyme [Brevefilum sp.]|nr:thiamine pyrophosphate-dependent enzyme [Brevefilum sp.]